MLDYPYTLTPKAQVCYGILACIMSHTSSAWEYLSPILTAIATIGGAFIAIHGCYMIYKGGKNGRE